MRVRTAVAADLPRMVEMVRASATGAQWTETQFARLLSEGSSKRLGWVVEVETEAGLRVEGFVIVHAIPPECEIENVVIDPLWRRRGLAKSLVGVALTQVRQMGCEAMFLEVRESNLGARGLYKKCGFREVGRRVKYYAQPEEDAVVCRIDAESLGSKMVQT